MIPTNQSTVSLWSWTNESTTTLPSSHLAVVLGQDSPTSSPVDVRGGVGSDIAGDGEVGLLELGVVLSLPLPHTDHGRV